MKSDNVLHCQSKEKYCMIVSLAHTQKKSHNSSPINDNLKKKPYFCLIMRKTSENSNQGHPTIYLISNPQNWRPWKTKEVRETIVAKKNLKRNNDYLACGHVDGTKNDIR